MESPEEWLVLEVRLPETASEGRRAAVGRALLDLGGSSLREEGRMLRTWLAPPESPGDFRARARARLREAGAGERGADGGAGAEGSAGLQLRWRRAPARDWSRRWREGLGPRRVGCRLVVAPGWSDVDPGDDEVVLRVDPGMAFGTGEHGTTRGALRLLERAVRPGDRVLDVGTGSGILALAAARLGARTSLGIESDGDAARTARENVRRNDLEDRVRILHLRATPTVLRLLAPPAFHVVTANILAPILRRLLPGFGAVIRADGRLILGGILEEERGEVLGAARGAGWRLESQVRDDGWWTACVRPRSPER